MLRQKKTWCDVIRVTAAVVQKKKKPHWLFLEDLDWRLWVEISALPSNHCWAFEEKPLKLNSLICILF